MYLSAAHSFSSAAAALEAEYERDEADLTARLFVSSRISEARNHCAAGAYQLAQEAVEAGLDLLGNPDDSEGRIAKIQGLMILGIAKILSTTENNISLGIEALQKARTTADELDDYRWITRSRLILAKALWRRGLAQDRESAKDLLLAM